MTLPEVVDDAVDSSHARVVAAREEIQKVAEQRGGLPCGAGRVEHLGADIERASQVELLVLTWRDNAALFSAQHPIAPDLGIEVNVDFVGVENGLLGAGA